MTSYTPREFTFRPLVIRDHPELAGPPYNLVIQMLDPDAVAVLAVELDRIELFLPSMDAFNERYKER